VTAPATDRIAPVATRTAYRDLLPRLMAADERVVCIDTDTGLFAGVDFGPAASRYVDLGIAEHTAIGAAAGLAAAGWIPFVTTMATFASTRALEAVKLDVAHNRLPVRIVATHGGVAAAHLGPTHHALEDLAILRTLPHLTVVVPADAAGTEAALTEAVGWAGPVYLRLGRKPTPALPAGTPPPALGSIQVLRAGADVVIAGCGPHPVHAALGAADRLARVGVAAAVLNVHTVAPLDRATLLAHAASARLVVTVEEHRVTGGLGGAVAEILGEALPRRVLRLGLAGADAAGAGSQDHILDHHGLGPGAVADRIRTALTLELT
jgi:transketolase